MHIKASSLPRLFLMSNYKTVIPEELLALYEVHDYHHAAAILHIDFPDLFKEVCECLLAFRFKEDWITKPGGSESEIPKAFSSLFRPMGWKETELEAKLVVTEKLRRLEPGTESPVTGSTEQDTHEVVYGTHNIDYVKGLVAVDLEWNSKDQTFDRDLYAFRAFFDYGKIDVGILITRSNNLDPYFVTLGKYIDKNGVERYYKDKYGASTTHMGKLLPRMNAGRQGGCPILVFGITSQLLEKKA